MDRGIVSTQVPHVEVRWHKSMSGNTLFECPRCGEWLIAEPEHVATAGKGSAACPKWCKDRGMHIYPVFSESGRLK